MDAARYSRKSFRWMVVATAVALLALLTPATHAAPHTPGRSDASRTDGAPADLDRVEAAMIYVSDEETVAGEPRFSRIPGFLISSDGLALVANIGVTGSKSHVVYVGDQDEEVEA